MLGLMSDVFAGIYFIYKYFIDLCFTHNLFMMNLLLLNTMQPSYPADYNFTHNKTFCRDSQ